MRHRYPFSSHLSPNSGRNRISLARSLGLCLAIAGLTGCGRAPAPSRQAEAWTPLTRDLPPTREAAPNSIEWVEASDQEVAAGLGPWVDASDLLPANDPLAERLQFWADQLDATLRQNYPSRFYDESGAALIPRPRLRLLLKNSPNAYVSSATTCYRVPILFKGAATEPAQNTSIKLLQLSGKGSIGIIDRDQVACLDRMQSPTPPERVVRFLRESAMIQGCTYAARGDALELGEDCQLASPARERGADGIVLLPTSNRITVETGLLELFPAEGQLVNTLFHELAHFYLGHGSLRKKGYNYFYRLNEENRLLPRPLPDPALAPLGLALLGLPQYRTQAIKGQSWHSELYSLSLLVLNSLVKPACGDEGSSCHDDCAPFSDLVLSPATKNLLGSFPQAQLKGEALARYFAWEKSLTQCLGGIRVGPRSEAGIVERATALKTFWLAPVPDPIPENWRVLDLAQSMSQFYFQRDAASDKLLQKALDERLGYYTTEEEADNFALQWMPRLGVSPENALEHWQLYSAQLEGREQDSPFNFTVTRCQELFAAEPRWSEGGQEVSVPIGSFGDTHHSPCFRLWNLDQRLRVRQEELQPSRFEEAERHGGPYKILRHRVIELHHQTRAPRRQECADNNCTAALEKSVELN